MGLDEEGYEKKRIKLFYHIFKNDAVSYEALQKIVRLRTYKWVRRVYAQANLAPKIVGMEELDVPVPNVLSISGAVKAEILEPATGKDRLDNNATLTLTVDGIDEAFTLPITAGIGLADVKDAVVAWLGDQGLKTTVEEVPMSGLKTAREADAQPSFDIYLFNADDSPKEFKSVKCTDVVLSKDAFEIPFLKGFVIDDNDSLVGGSPSQRVMLRMGASSDEQIDIYVVPKAALGGRAYPIYRETDYDAHPALLPPQPLRRAAWVSYESTARSSKGIVFDENWWVSPFTLAHEIDHVLADAGHNEAEGDLMKGSWSKVNSVEAEKRIYSAPILVGSPTMDNVGGGMRSAEDMREDLHGRRAGIDKVDGDVLEAW